ncbi:DNA methyltransferase 1-associated protein 1 [Lethenteron reissneri]|uniref:DNA methyltransferase 1-associated protein 1 n=1 Tax=Lethenteron reissneri TaxID=7753 RepID=UPI002AB6AF8D|nr:DNA methyltransferase 1-associated protein 1 [Lethenteron reissneri]
MGTGADVRDILELSADGEMVAPISKRDLLLQTDKKKSKKLAETPTFKRPEGMHREVYALLYSDNKDAPPVLPSDSSQGYRTVKARLGCRVVRAWRWTPFTHPARTDGAVFHHWRRATDQPSEYPFARFNKSVQVPVFTEQEYASHLQHDDWSRAETDHLLDLCQRFDLRWVVMHDRYDCNTYKRRSVEDLKERYYSMTSRLLRARAPPGTEPRAVPAFDAEHERRRKQQLERLFSRTPEQLAEEETLVSELRRIESRKKERERATQDLHKLMGAATSATDHRAHERKASKKKATHRRGDSGDRAAVLETAGIKFPDAKSAGVMLRSQRMKLPSSVGQKKVKAIEQILTELGIDLSPMPTEEVVLLYNELRSDLVLLYELKQALGTCEYERHTLTHRYHNLRAIAGGSEPPTTAPAPPGGRRGRAGAASAGAAPILLLRVDRRDP